MWKSTFWLLVFGLSLVAAKDFWDSNWDEMGEEWDDMGEEWEYLPLRPTARPAPKATTTSTTTTTTTTERAQTTTNAAPDASTTPTTTTERAQTTTNAAPDASTTTTDSLSPDYQYYEAAEGSLKLHPAAPWLDARLTCFGEEAELASPETAGLLEAMSSALLSSAQPLEEVFTGINDLYSKGVFSSLRGTALPELAAAARGAWAAGAPALTSRAGCLALRRDALLRDAACDAKLPYFCFRKMPAGPETECGTNPEYSYYKSTSSCYKVHKSPSTWGDAYATCRREGAHLLVLSSTGEAAYIRHQARRANIGNIHVGATRWKDDVWMTVHGETLAQAGFDRWKKEARQRGEGESAACARLLLPDALLANSVCSEELAFVCEKKAYV